MAADSVDALMRLVADVGLDAMPDLGAFFWDAEGLHGLTRGAVRMVDTASGEVALEGQGTLTWREANLGGERHLRIDLEPVDDDEVLQLPLVVGAASASAIYLTTDPEALVRFPSYEQLGALPKVPVLGVRPRVRQAEMAAAAPKDTLPLRRRSSRPSPGLPTSSRPSSRRSPPTSRESPSGNRTSRTNGPSKRWGPSRLPRWRSPRYPRWRSPRFPRSRNRRRRRGTTTRPWSATSSRTTGSGRPYPASAPRSTTRPTPAPSPFPRAPVGAPAIPAPAAPAPERQAPVVVPPRLGEIDDDAGGTIFSTGLAATHKPAPQPEQLQGRRCWPCHAPTATPMPLAHGPAGSARLRSTPRTRGSSAGRCSRVCTPTRATSSTSSAGS
ncbi:hypothetical protein G7085_13075 [Tessaracoccus sp. HDW20]|uniref:hypothetical protein n=1 Tax=Tessaracoccus coleopterorum TaxID=2714950 RepID=UPI0018D3D441|nr:hypothetical protein [Tessaracoccus coleopterorum]NHB85245.1 hypothetical protein [Tessaracoccus coleopterorum]